MIHYLQADLFRIPKKKNPLLSSSIATILYLGLAYYLFQHKELY